MVNVYLSEQDGDVHFSTVNCKAKELEECRELFRQNYLKFDSVTKDWTFPIRLSVLSVVDSLNANGIETHISQEDIDVLKLATVYPHSNELHKVKYSLDKYMLELHPPLKGKEGFENFQLEASKKLVQTNRGILDISCRHGKSKISCDSVGSLYKLGVIDRILIICRNEGVSNFESEILRFIPYFTEDEIAIVSTENRDIESYFDKKIIITNYITFRLSCAYYNPKASIKSRKPMIDFNKWGKSRCIILDEFQSMNHYDSLQTHMIQLHRDYFEYRYGLSGTLGFNFLSWFSLAKFMLPNRMTMGFSEWRDYVTTGRFHDKVIESRAKEFKENILDKLLITYHDCIVQPLDEKIITYVDMTEDFRKIYKEICNKYITEIFELGNGKANPNDALLKFGELSKLTSNPSLIKGYENFKIKDNPKFDILKSLLDKYINEQGKRVIIWSTHPSVLNELGQELAKYKPLIIHGDASTSVKKDERIDELNAFKKDPTRKILLTNKVLSTSISVTECSRQIYWDIPLNSDDLEQSMERIRGPRQTEQTETNFLLFSKSVDLYIWFEIIKKKSSVRKAILEKQELKIEDFKKMLNPDKKYYVEGTEV